MQTVTSFRALRSLGVTVGACLLVYITIAIISTPKDVHISAPVPLSLRRIALPKCDHTSKPIDQQSLVYITYISSGDAYADAVLALACSLKLSGTPHLPLVVLIPENDSDIDSNVTAALSASPLIKLKYVPHIEGPPGVKPRLRKNWTRFRIWGMTEYDRIIFLDADTIVMRNIDHLFQLPATPLAGVIERVNGTSSNVNGGVMVVTPCKEMLEDMMASIYSPDFDHLLTQNLLLWYFGFENILYLPFPYNFRFETLMLKKESAYVLHFWGKRKPWHDSSQRPTKSLPILQDVQPIWQSMLHSCRQESR